MTLKNFLTSKLACAARCFTSMKLLYGLLVLFCMISIVFYFNTNNQFQQKTIQIIRTIINNPNRSVDSTAKDTSQNCTVLRPKTDDSSAQKINLQLMPLVDIESSLLTKHKFQFGGEYIPESSLFSLSENQTDKETCKLYDNSKYKIAIIIPYRDRKDNLKLFLNNMHPYLIRQRLNYKIYLVEPLANLTFNRGILMNIGFVEALKDSDDKWNCFIFHDVDMVPENANTIYECNDDLPIHYAVAVSKFGYKTDGYFQQYFGGITAFTKEQYLKINGFSNLFFGWGGEDDELYKRAIKEYSKVIKLTPKTGRYFMADHKGDIENPDRFRILNDNSRLYDKDRGEGLNKLSYTLRVVEKHILFTKFIVSYIKSEIVKGYL